MPFFCVIIKHFLSLSCALLLKSTLLQVNVMLKQLPEEEFGPGIDIREYSLLDNPSLPSEVNYMSFSFEIVIIPFFLYLTRETYTGFLEFRWRIHGLMFSSVRKELKIVLHQIIPLLGEYSNFQGIAMKKRYFKFWSI